MTRRSEWRTHDEVGFGGGGYGGRGRGRGRERAKDADSVARVNRGGCLVIREVVECAAFGGGDDYYGDCLEREREWTLWLKMVEGAFWWWWPEWVTNLTKQWVQAEWKQSNLKDSREREEDGITQGMREATAPNDDG